MTQPTVFERLRLEWLWTKILIIRRLRMTRDFICEGLYSGRVSAEDLEKLRNLAAQTEIWREIALSREGEGRAAKYIQEEARAEERAACENICRNIAENTLVFARAFDGQVFCFQMCKSFGAIECADAILRQSTLNHVEGD